MEALTSRQDDTPPLADDKFVDPDRTAKGEPRAAVPLARLETLWFNTGTLCNIACVNCYIESDPRNDRLEYITAAEVALFLDEIENSGYATREIGFTGGEPFLNPDMLEMASDALKRGFEVLILTNAMKPMQRPRIKAGLLDLKARHGGRLKLRVSLDHYGQELHETERGKGSWQVTLDGLDWLAAEGFRIAIAGRTCWQEPEDALRTGYRHLFDERRLSVDAQNPSELVLFPEMNERLDIAEITTACWGILGVDPLSVMCATSRMVVKRKGAERPTVLPCTLIAYDQGFEMGESLEEADHADGGNFKNGAVKLNHPHCARFCVLGGGSCSI